MNGLDLIYIIIGLTMGGIFVCAYLLKRILNVLTQMNNGEPSQEDLRDIEFSKFKMKG